MVSVDPRTGGSLTPRGMRTKNAIIQAAREVFEQKGYGAARIQDIARQAQVSRATIYLYFETKEAIFDELFDEFTGTLKQDLRVGHPEADPVTRIALANHLYFKSYERNSQLFDVMSQVATHDPDKSEVLSELHDYYVTRVIRGIQSMQKMDLIAKDIDPRTTAYALCAMIENMARFAYRNASPGSADVVLNTVTRLWVQSLGLDPNSRFV